VETRPGTEERKARVDEAVEGHPHPDEARHVAELYFKMADPHVEEYRRRKEEDEGTGDEQE